MKILRLLLFEECNRACPGCCNKDWDLKNLPVFDGDFTPFDQVILTGGEPMLKPQVVIDVAKRVPRGIPVYVYTAKVDDFLAVEHVLDYVDGLTVTLHEQSDVEPFIRLKTELYWCEERYGNKSLRLNVFEGVQLEFLTYDMWKIKSDIVWIKDCPLPNEEVFMRLEAPKHPNCSYCGTL